jgi:cation transporter-like permease
MKKFGIVIASYALPLMAGAQTGTGTDLGYFENFLGDVRNILNMLLPIIIAAAVVYFVYGIARYVMSGDEAAKEVAKGKIIYGIIGLFVMISVWGLVRILTRVTGVDSAAAPTNVDNLLPTR